MNHVLLVNYHMLQCLFLIQAFEHAGDVVISASAMAILPLDAQANALFVMHENSLGFYWAK
jgi:hypothetical protein